MSPCCGKTFVNVLYNKKVTGVRTSVSADFKFFRSLATFFCHKDEKDEPVVVILPILGT